MPVQCSARVLCWVQCQCSIESSASAVLSNGARVQCQCSAESSASLGLLCVHSSGARASLSYCVHTSSGQLGTLKTTVVDTRTPGTLLISVHISSGRLGTFSTPSVDICGHQGKSSLPPSCRYCKSQGHVKAQVMFSLTWQNLVAMQVFVTDLV